MKFNDFFKEKFSTFIDLETKLIKSDYSNKEKGDIFEEFVFAYFSINKQLYNIKDVYMAQNLPESIIKELQLEKIDHGVDGVFVDNDNKKFAYQVKFRSNRSEPPTYMELSTFLTESEYAFSRCTVSNCYFLPKIIDKKNNHFAILNDTFMELDSQFFEELYHFTHNERIVITKKKPRNHQTTIINDVVEKFKSSNRGKVISACGTGKTLTALWIVEKMQTKNVLFVVPNLALISQTLKEWSNQAEEPFSYLCVCSDKTVSGDLDENCNATSDLPFPVTTNPTIIKEFLESNTKNRKIIFSTYQSLDVLSYSLNELDFSFDLGIFDEAHRTAGAKDSDSFVFGLQDKYIKINKRLFMTATERVVTTRIKNSLKDTEYEVYSMDDENVYGPTFSKLNFGMAIEQGIISNYQVIVACVKSEEYASLINKNIIIKDGNKISALDQLTKRMILTHVFDDLNIKKVITYHQSVAKAKNFIEDDKLRNELSKCLEIDKNSIYCDHVNGEMSTREKYVKFREFESKEIGVLTNARCLTEGVDIPAIDAVYFSDPKNSTIDIIQAVGRALRISDKKAISNQSYIIIPVIIPDNIEKYEDCDCKIFETLHAVVQALRDQDSNLADIIDELNMSIARGNSGHGKINDKIKIIVPASINADELYQNLSLRIAEVNKDPSGKNTHYTVSDAQNARASDVTRRFRTMGDMTAESYRDSLVMPTLEKFTKDSDVISSNDLKINHNNYSHTKRLGLIVENNKMTKLTPNGKKLFNREVSFDDMFKAQMLIYGERNPDNNKMIFPYRSTLRIMQKLEYLSQLEFAFGLYSMVGTSPEDEIDVINRVFYIRNNYPNIEILSAENQETILHILNNKFGYNFSYQDVWTNRSTVYNQFNYFKCHLAFFSNCFTKTRDKINYNTENNNVINQLLRKTSFIESLDDDKRNIIYVGGKIEGIDY